MFDLKSKPKGEVIIIGCGRLGSTLASVLSENGGTVSIIDRNRGAFRKLSPSYGGLTIVGNATDLEVLEEARINSNTTVICVTNTDNVNIMAAQITKTMFSAGRVIARLHNHEKACVYEEQDIETICPAALSVAEINGLINGEVEKDNRKGGSV